MQCSKCNSILDPHSNPRTWVSLSSLISLKRKMKPGVKSHGQGYTAREWGNEDKPFHLVPEPVGTDHTPTLGKRSVLEWRGAGKCRCPETHC